jgi:hypothetical protein
MSVVRRSLSLSSFSGETKPFSTNNKKEGLYTQSASSTTIADSFEQIAPPKPSTSKRTEKVPVVSHGYTELPGGGKPSRFVPADPTRQRTSQSGTFITSEPKPSTSKRTEKVPVVSHGYTELPGGGKPSRFVPADPTRQRTSQSGTFIRANA